MKITETSKALLFLLEPKLKSFGFILKQSKNTFIKTTPSFEQGVYFIFTKSSGSVLLEIRWYIKIPAICDIYNTVTSKAKAFYMDTACLENSLGELVAFKTTGSDIPTGKSTYYLIENSNDIDVLIPIISNHFEKLLIPYFEENSNIESIDRLLNLNPRELTIHNWLYPFRACIGLIAAKLARNPKLTDLEQIYKEELNESTDSWKDEFTKLCKLLNNLDFKTIH